MIDQLAQDVRIALRGLRRSPTFTVTAISILGLGIGMAVAMWTVCDAVLLQRLPVRDQDAIVVLHAFDQSGVDLAVSPADFEQWRHETRTMRDVAGFAHWGSFVWPLVNANGRSVVLSTSEVTGNFFQLLGTKPILGRLLTPTDDAKGAAPAMVLSYGAWQRQFGGSPAILGHRLTDPGRQLSYVVVGVAPPGLDFPAGTDCWAPIALFGGAYMTTLGRLAPGATIAGARGEYAALMQRVTREQHAQWHLSRFEAGTLPNEIVGNVRPALVALTAAVGLLLLVACVNVGTLLLMRAAMRSRELAVRGALGASYGAIVRLLCTESALLGIGGGVLALLCADVLRRMLVAVAPVQLPRADVLRIAGLPIGSGGGGLDRCRSALRARARADRRAPPPSIAHAGSPCAEGATPGNSVAYGTDSLRRKSRWRSSCWLEPDSWDAACNASSRYRSATRQTTCRFSNCRSPGSNTIRNRRFCRCTRRSASVSPHSRASSAVTPVLIPPFMGPSVWTGPWQTTGGATGPRGDTDGAVRSG